MINDIEEKGKFVINDIENTSLSIINDIDRGGKMAIKDINDSTLSIINDIDNGGKLALREIEDKSKFALNFIKDNLELGWEEFQKGLKLLSGILQKEQIQNIQVATNDQSMQLLMIGGGLLVVMILIK